ncbi:hypothetical protein CRG98_005379 [Punica granatum]|uniref:Retrotransposon gag domain-containing protein n=1 Tax=Punica granatum TaxID=22663 RepID=A0A2I0L0K3_PUNGR|nr:hypothetical protein CRG98_005379 [Punica granatum]
MTLKAGDIPTWTDLSQKFLDQHRFCAETPSTLLDLSLMQMKEDQTFEAYAAEWRGKAAKHIPLITERQQVQLLHSTLRGAYYSHLLVHTSSFSDLIEVGNKLDMGVKLGKIDGPSRKKDGETSKKHIGGTSKRGLGPSINMISIAAIGEEEDVQDHQVPWNYGGEVANTERETSAMGITRSGHVYQGPELADKGKAPATSFSAIPEAAPLLTKKVTEQEAEAFMKVIKASEYKVVEQMGKSPAHFSLLALLLSSEPHRDTLLKVLTAAQVLKETTPDRIEETVNSIFSNQISFAEDELPSEGQGHLPALHIVCKYNNHVVGRVMIDNGSSLNVCLVSTLKQMNVDMSRIRVSKTTVQAFDGFRRELNGEIDLLINVGPCSFSVTFQILEIPNAFSLLLGRPWIHAAGAVPSSLH